MLLQSIFCIIVYIAALAAPMFFVATLFASAAAGIDEALDEITIPSISDSINLGPFDFLGGALDAITEIINDLLRGILYFILIILFDLFVSGVKAQFIGGFTSIFFLVSYNYQFWP